VGALGSLVRVSQRVGASSSRLGKIRELASFLKTLAPDDVDIAVHYLSGTIPEGRIGVGHAALRDAAAQAPADSESLSIAEVDRSIGMIAAIRGGGSSARRAQALRDLFVQATSDEQRFLLRLLIGELRQGALEGIMIDAIAAAAEIPAAQVRRAAMYSKGLGAVAVVALVEGSHALVRFQLELFSPVSPMLAQTAVDVS
jgi:DNA ligase-1